MSKESKSRQEEGLSVGIKIGEHTLYTVEPIELTPQIRLEAYMSRSYEVNELKLRHSDLIAFCETIKQYGQEGKFMDVQILNGYFETLLKLPYNVTPSMYMVSPMILINDEPLKKMTPEYEALKQKLVKDNQEARSFFFSRLILLSSMSTITSSSGEPVDYSIPPTKIQTMTERAFFQSTTE